MTALLVVLGGIGLTSIVVDSEIAAAPKNWLRQRIERNLYGSKLLYLLNCYQCCGFWVGAILGAAVYGTVPAVLVVAGVVSYSAPLGMAVLDTIHEYREALKH